MFTQDELGNLERNFRAYSRDILMAEAHDTWHHVILDLIEMAHSAPSLPMRADVDPFTKAFSERKAYG